MIELARREHEPLTPEPLTWYLTFRHDQEGVVFYCPYGHAGFIGGLAIAEDGKVTESVICDQDDCTWDDEVQLMDWNSPPGGIDETEHGGGGEGIPGDPTGSELPGADAEGPSSESDSGSSDPNGEPGVG